jgi:hypothetical protein
MGTANAKGCSKDCAKDCTQEHTPSRLVGRPKRQRRWPGRREAPGLVGVVRSDDLIEAKEQRSSSAPQLDLERIARSDSDSRLEADARPGFSCRSAPLELGSPRYYGAMPVPSSTGAAAGGTASSERIFFMSMASESQVSLDAAALGRSPVIMNEPVLLERIEDSSSGAAQFRSRERSNTVSMAPTALTPRRMRADTWDNGADPALTGLQINTARAIMLRDSLTPHGSRVSESGGFDAHGYVVTPYLQCTMSGVIYASAELRDDCFSAMDLVLAEARRNGDEPQSVGSV